MKVKLFVFVFISLLVSAATAKLAAQSPKNKGLEINIQDFKAKGVALIPLTDPSFKAHISKLTRNNPKAIDFLNVIDPFGVLFWNPGNRAVVAYKLRWIVVNDKGQTRVMTDSYIDSGYLMSMRVLNRQGDFLPSNTIRTGNSRLLTFLSSYNLLTSSPPQMIPDEILLEASNIREAFANTKSVTVVLDGLFFENGAFVGNPTSRFYDEVEAQVRAKRDILTGIKRGAVKNRNVEDIFVWLSRIASQPNMPLPTNATPRDIYNHFRIFYAQEILNIRGATRNDLETINKVIKPLSGKWAKLHKEK